jgi:hypothetical protein
MHGLRIGLGINRHAAYAETPRRTDDADGELTAIGDQHRFEQCPAPVPQTES